MTRTSMQYYRSHPSKADRLKHGTEDFEHLAAKDQPDDMQRRPEHDQDRRPDGHGMAAQ